MTELDAVNAEALKIPRIVGRLRAAEPRQSKGFVPALDWNPKPVMMSRGEPAPDATSAQAFQAAIRFWALRVAPLVTFREWEAMVAEVARQVPDYPGDAVRFFENRFEGLSLKDGTLILS